MKKLSVFIFIPLCLAFHTQISFATKTDFTLWQLPSQIDSHMNSYVFLMANGKVCVMDGGSKAEAPYLRGFLAALGNEVEAWFITHPHFDHIEALNEILKAPNGIKIRTIYHCQMSSAYYDKYETYYKPLTVEFYENLQKYTGQIVDRVVNLTKPGQVITVSNTHFKILAVNDESITENPYNNQSMVIKVWDKKKSVLFLADLGVEGGDNLLKSPYAKDLSCDYLQMAHHGQAGVSKDFYRAIRFKACLWPTPSWLYNNDAGKGFNTHTWETVEIRQLMDELGIKKHYIAFQGLTRID